MSSMLPGRSRTVSGDERRASGSFSDPLGVGPSASASLTAAPAAAASS
eukprot:CAMPEP_0177569368 /NCGR_PEP_ID=MMETSP0369-20130122/76254_1 /TAXON_ID=447022 ORGANISM="Scrippsiella hangoei-like, Strain SHHI-4" /NCGR_SAMPLE_ID=MMETSP0369 /ASSEMBLY_ACC=CAM_ASM_000364 /LENGTH=47 /DNA_ID= /DNA_START= /DNA_END= /DNA_ORIENTATION=